MPASHDPASLRRPLYCSGVSGPSRLLPLAPEVAARPGYRPDIQGLRGIAVLVVVILHSGLPLAGGFTGVDIFFVISGFVITSSLVSRLEVTGRLAMGRFYLARIRRLLPALAVMLTVVLIASMALGAIGALGITARTGAAASLINANNYLAVFDVGGYFDAASALNPLLHTWSLSVEEQFYLVFPGLLLVSWLSVRATGRLKQRSRIRLMLIAIIAASFGAAAFLSLIVPSAEAGGFWGRLDYYSAVTRAWEFGAGALLAVTPIVAMKNRRVATAAGAAGTVLVGIGLVVISESVTYPGPITLLPVVGAVLVIAAGTSVASNPVSRTLTTKPMVGLGNLSYSWYLWHWPFIVFAGIWWSGALGPRVIAGAASLGVAWLSVRYIEEPIRYRSNPLRRNTLWLLVACVGIPLAAAGILAQWHQTLKSDASLNPFALHADSLLDCDSPKPLSRKPADCNWRAPQSRGRAVLVGDSLAGHYTEGFVSGVNSAGLDAQVATLSACTFIDFGPLARQARRLGMRPEPSCSGFVGRTMDDLVADPPELVVMSTSTQRYLRALADEPDPAAAANLAARQALWTQAQTAMIRRLTDAGSRVVIVGSVPRFPAWGELKEGPFKESPAITLLAGSAVEDAAIPRDQARRAQLPGMAAQAAAIDATGATSIDFFDVVCPSSTCTTGIGSSWTYRDFEHLSVATSKILAPAFRDLARQLLPGG